MSDNIKNYMHHMWYTLQDGIATIGINDDGLEDVSEINSLELPQEQDAVDADTPIGTIETDDGQLDIFAPGKGTVIEVNTQLFEDPELIMEDSYEEGWLLRIEMSEDLADDEDEDDEDLDEEDDDDEDVDADEEEEN